MKCSVTAVVVAALAVTACVAREGKDPSTISALQRSVRSQQIADGVTLEAGENGTLPVRVAWVREAPYLETTATDGADVFVIGEVVEAIRARDGRVQWVLDPYRSDDPWIEEWGLGASGGVQVGLADDGAVVRVFAPWEFDIELDRTTGRVLRSGPADGGDVPKSRFEQLPPFAPRSYRIDQSVIGTVDARLASGEQAFRIREQSPQYDPAPPMEVGGLIVLTLSSGYVVALRPAT